MPIMTQKKFDGIVADLERARRERDAELNRRIDIENAHAERGRLLKLRTEERDAAMATLDEALLLVEALFARQNELALAMGKEPPFLEDLRVIREILNGEGRSVT